MIIFLKVPSFKYLLLDQSSFYFELKSSCIYNKINILNLNYKYFCELLTPLILVSLLINSLENYFLLVRFMNLFLHFLKTIAICYYVPI
jgi:hypothetical protein